MREVRVSDGASACVGASGNCRDSERFMNDGDFEGWSTDGTGDFKYVGA